MLVVAVGDRQKIEAELLKLNLGAAEVRDVEGAVVTRDKGQGTTHHTYLVPCPRGVAARCSSP